MPKTLFQKSNLFEKYNKLVTEEGKKIFIRTVYTLSICTAAIIFIWYCGIVSLTSHSDKGFVPEQFNNAFLFQTANQTITLLSKTTSDVTDKGDLTTDTAQPAGEKKSPDGSSPQPADSSLAGFKENKNNEKTNNIIDKKDVQKTDNKTDVKKADKKAVNEKKPEKKQASVPKTIYAGANRPNVALTFDDGYNKKTIIKVLDSLKKNNVKATFFIIGKVLDDYPEVWKRAVAEGHQICNHTASHKTLTSLSDEQVKNEITGWETCVKKVLGKDYFDRMKKEFPYLRLPGGGGAKSNRILSIAQTCGYKVIGWNLETISSVINPMRSNNSVPEIADKIQQHVVNRCSNGSIILLHFNEYDIRNIDGIITGIKKRGFGLQTVTQVISKN